MWQAILRFFGLGKRPGEGPSGVPKKNYNPKNYYRRGGNYYSVADDSLIEDLILIDILMGYYEEGHIQEVFEAPEAGDISNVDTSYEDRTEPEIGDVDILDVDVSDTPVVAVEGIDIWKDETPSEPEPEPVKQAIYSSGYSDSSSSYDSSDSYDSGGSDD